MNASVTIFQQAIRQMDRAISTLRGRQMFCLPQIQNALDELERFYIQAQAEIGTEQQRMIAAGCRVGSDLNEMLSEQLSDLLCQQDRHVQELSEKMKQAFRERAQTLALLNQAQEVRQLTDQTAQASGLGTIL